MLTIKNEKYKQLKQKCKDEDAEAICTAKIAAYSEEIEAQMEILNTRVAEKEEQLTSLTTVIQEKLSEELKKLEQMN